MNHIHAATLVQGPNDVYLTYANSRAQLTLGEECTFSGTPGAPTSPTLAICTIVAQGSTATQTEAVSYLPIQGGGVVGPPSSGSSISSPSAPGFTTGSSTMVKGTDGDASSGTDMVSDSSGAVTPPQSGALPSASSSGLPSSSNYKPDMSHWLVLVVLTVLHFLCVSL
ncbi:hypothetical protein JR316_0003927 [Psilocybe cubensis]|uniref:Uncharacterized protein n=1 Tax=Psilocybe cubensis TaxID=181762 RepID=A0ACB8HBB5_PSICU|nr:hypothetical protein JR316_0003927 [Psilocybe cubensis]KAH9484445.1 hypothetical protein JR316_0003927 [Psilocybe cubensis]